MLLNQNCALVDLETTGANHKFSAIMEFGCLLMDADNHVQAYEQLIHPGQHVPHFITSLTGINNQMLEDQPNFSEVSDTLYTLLENRIFIAHNVRFDYGFLKRAFQQQGKSFRPKLICTVKLARQLYPDWPSYSLDNICKQIAYTRDSSHRAMADVLATKAFLDYAIADLGLTRVNAAAEKQLSLPVLPKGLNKEEFDQVAETPGVYRFYDKDNILLYVGKSKNMRNRILSHFQNDIRQQRSMQMNQQISRLETTICGGEVAALLQENQQIKSLQPTFNRRQRRTAKLWCIHSETSQNGFLQLKVSASLTGSAPQGNQFGFYKSKKHADKVLNKLISENKLCEKVNNSGDNTKASPCFARQLKRCKGVCEQLETKPLYNLRVEMAIQDFQTIPWPYQGPIAMIEENPDHNIVSVSYIDQWACLHSSNITLDSQDTENHRLLSFNDLQSLPRVFDKDMYRVIKKALQQNVTVIEINSNDLSETSA